MKSSKLQAPSSRETSNTKPQPGIAPAATTLHASRSTLFCFLLFAFCFSALAQPTRTPPGQISYQGFLTDANGIPLATNAPRNYTIVFRIYDSSGSGNLLWVEQQIVTVDRGYFTVMLGAGTSYAGQQSLFTNNLSGLFSGSTASDRYIGTTVNELSLSEIAPRLRLLASPYSFLASKAMSVDSSGSVPDSSLSPNVARRDVGNTFFGDQHFTSGDLYMDKDHAILANNEIFLWPRFSDNATYLNYGSGGFNIRNNNNQTVMTMSPAADEVDILANAGIDGNAYIDFDADIGGNALISGYVGIGTSALNFPLTFAPSLGDKIALYPSTGNTSYGFGVQGYQLQIHTDTSLADVVFGYGSSAAFTETMRIKGNGNVGIGTNPGNNRLQIGNLYESAAGYGLVVASPQYGANIQVTNFTGYGLLADYLGNNSFNAAAQMLTVRNNGSTTFDVYANGDCHGGAFYGTAFNTSSDRNAKENFQPVSPEEVLDKVASLPIQEWNFKTDETRHIGPMAQDFYAAFGVGPDEKHIATVDADGVALAAIQGLNKKLEAKENEIVELKARLDKLEQLLSHNSNGTAR